MRNRTLRAQAWIGLAGMCILAGCNGPPGRGWQAGLWQVGARQAPGDLSSGVGATLGIGGEFVGDFSFVFRGRGSYAPGEEDAHGDLRMEFGFLDFGRAPLAQAWIFGWGFGWPEGSNFGTGPIAGYSLYFLLGPETRLEFLVTDALWLGIDDDGPTTWNEVEVAVILSLGL